VSTVEEALIPAQRKAEELFAEIIHRELIRANVLESKLSKEIHALANRRFGVRRHWHKRIVRCGRNTLLTYHDEPTDRRIGADDVVYLDFGPLFGRVGADFGRAYVLGADPLKHQLVHDIAVAFRRGKQRFLADPDLTGGTLYDYVCELPRPSAGNLVPKPQGISSVSSLTRAMQATPDDSQYATAIH
jgi:Xaa-Pro dipeptidase